MLHAFLQAGTSPAKAGNLTPLRTASASLDGGSAQSATLDAGKAATVTV